MIILEVPVGVLYDSKYNRYNCNIYPLSPPNIYKALFQATMVCLLLLEKDIHVISRGFQLVLQSCSSNERHKLKGNSRAGASKLYF